jgi:hypothetical protein
MPAGTERGFSQAYILNLNLSGPGKNLDLTVIATSKACQQQICSLTRKD